MKTKYKISLTIIISLLLALCATAPANVLAASKKKVQGSRPRQYKVVPRVLSRSGLPNSKQFKTLQSLGIKSVINLIPTNEKGGKGDVGAVGFRYLYIPLIGSFPPSIEEADKFLAFVKNAGNWPVHIYCVAGNARTGTFIAIYRYSMQGWTMQRAIHEANRFGGGLSKKQTA